MSGIFKEIKRDKYSKARLGDTGIHASRDKWYCEGDLS